MISFGRFGAKELIIICLQHSIIDLSVFPWSKTYFTWHIDVSGFKKVVIHQTINGTFTDHDRVAVIDTNMVNGLLLFDERREKVIKTFHFIFCKVDASTCLV